MSSLDAINVPKDVLLIIFNYVFDDYTNTSDMRGRNEMLASIKDVCDSWRKVTVDDKKFMISFLTQKCKPLQSHKQKNLTEDDPGWEDQGWNMMGPHEPGHWDNDQDQPW